MSGGEKSSTVSGSEKSSTVSGSEKSTVPDESTAPEAKPVLRVVKGEPSAEELAALIAVVSARSVVAVAPKAKQRSEWGHPARAVRRPLRFGPGGWRKSAW